MKKEKSFTIHLNNNQNRFGVNLMNSNGSVEITYDNLQFVIKKAKRSMGKTKLGNPDPLVRHLYGIADGPLPRRYMLTVNCGFRIPKIYMMDLTSEVELFSCTIDHEEQLKIDEFIDDMLIPEQYPTGDWLQVKKEDILS